MIFLKKVSNKKDLRNFVMFPFQLYKGSKCWIPPIINQEMNNFNKDLNPNLQDSKVELFLAYQDKNVVGSFYNSLNKFKGTWDLSHIIFFKIIKS